MAYEDITQLLAGWEGVELVAVTQDVSVALPVIALTLQVVGAPEALQRVWHARHGGP